MKMTQFVIVPDNIIPILKQNGDHKKKVREIQQENHVKIKIEK